VRKLYHEEIQRQRLAENESAKVDNRFPFIAILDNIRSLYNVGSIFRTSDGGRIEALFTVGYTPHPPREEIEKTALGATRTVPHQHFEKMSDAISEARLRGYTVAALELTTNSRSIYTLQRSDFPLALVVGNEVTGVSSEALELVNFAIDIPMIGAKHSLNVAVSYGVALYECLRVFEQNLSDFQPK
jgi:tRNA G18 (ribose-2'-O)-methylase SpoU